MSEIVRDLILMALGANLVMFAGGAFLGSNDLMILSVLNMLMLGLGISVRDWLNDKDNEP